MSNSMSPNDFDYCFWAKFIVGVPAVTIIVHTIASMFHNPILQILVGAWSGVLAVYIAMKIDSLPMLQGPIVKHRK